VQRKVLTPNDFETLREVPERLNALVYRGAARDFLDIRGLVTRGIVSVEQCWDWWARKNPDDDLREGKAQAPRHLEALELRRSIGWIGDAAERTAARQAREWIRRNLLRGPGDNASMQSDCHVMYIDHSV
jgi:hypothetical protein